MNIKAVLIMYKMYIKVSKWGISESLILVQ
jgi:hypothetical protein